MWIELAGVATALLVALVLRPWRGLPSSGPPWPWLAWWALLPALWGADRYLDTAVVQPLSGACLQVLMAGWPLAILGFGAAAVLTAGYAQLDVLEAAPPPGLAGRVAGHAGAGAGAGRGGAALPAPAQRNFKRPREGTAGMREGMRQPLQRPEVPGFGDHAVALCRFGRSLSVQMQRLWPEPQD